jgi:hypothetical protein
MTIGGINAIFALGVLAVNDEPTFLGPPSRPMAAESDSVLNLAGSRQLDGVRASRFTNRIKRMRN